MSLGTALVWKHNGAPGIRTRDGVIIAWPAGLGPEPDAAAQAAIIAEWEAFDAAEKAKRVVARPNSSDNSIPKIRAKVQEMYDVMVQKGDITPP